MISELPHFRLSVIAGGAIGRGPQGSLLFPQQHEGSVYCDPRKPRRKTRSAFEGVKVNESPQQGVLQHIFCILPVVRYAIDSMQHAPGMAPAEFIEGGSISGPRHGNQHRIFHGIRFPPLGDSIEF